MYQQPVHCSASSPPLGDEILVLINTTPLHIQRALGVFETWGSSARTLFVIPRVCDVEDVEGMGKVNAIFKNFPDKCMDLKLAIGIDHCYEYPPIYPWLRSLEMVAEYNFKWLVKCDDDVYVNVPRLRKFLRSKEKTCQIVPCYFGSLGYGRRQERQLLGLNGTPFVMGGPCVVISSSAYQKVLPILPSCMVKPTGHMHADTQLGRCFLQVNISAGISSVQSKKLNQLFKHYQPVSSKLRGKTMKPYLSTTVPSILSRRDKQRISLHTIKTREEMHKIHLQFR